MDQKQALVDRLKQANNILVTVSNNPSVDQLASCIGLTLALNKLNKHGTAVFSGDVPDTIEFLQPDKTIEKNTDSLRDFIIALDKAKADKLRYKVEDKVVKIFITPYRTSITEKDLEFSQGDFNVDAVVAIGVHNQNDLDQAITAHGRILHDATVTTINVSAGGQFGAINWLDTKASSLSELVTELITELGQDVLDEQMATALLTGIVAETKRFSNDRTSPTTMTISAELMAAGANQQLVATKLEPPKPPTPPPAPAPPQGPHEEPIKPVAPAPEPPKPDDGTLEISHDASSLEDKEEPKEPDIAQIHIDDQGSLHVGGDLPQPKHEANTDPTKHMNHDMIMTPPSMGGDITGGLLPDEEERPAGEPMGSPSGQPGILQRSDPFAPSAGSGTPPVPSAPSPAISPAPFAPQPSSDDNNPYPSPFSDVPTSTPAPVVSAPAAPAPPQPIVVTPTVQPTVAEPQASTPPAPIPQGQTLSEIEQNVHSPHTQIYTPQPADQPTPGTVTTPTVVPPAPTPDPTPATDIDSARDAVMQAIAAQPVNPEPIQALNAQPLGSPLHDPAVVQPQDAAAVPQTLGGVAPPPLPPPMVPPAAQ